MGLENLLPPLVGIIIGAIIGFLSNLFLQKQRFNFEIKKIQEENKTDYMAVTTIKKFLNDEKYKDRKFSTIKSHLRGFEENELRKLLIRSGAICLNGKDDDEFWTLLDKKEKNISDIKLIIKSKL